MSGSRLDATAAAAPPTLANPAFEHRGDPMKLFATTEAAA